MTNEVQDALLLLIRETRAQPDSGSWASSMLAASGAAPQDIHFFVETWSAAAAKIGSRVLNEAERPACSFCLKASADVLAMVTSPNANICNECADIAMKTMDAKRGGGKLFAWIRRHL